MVLRTPIYEQIMNVKNNFISIDKYYMNIDNIRVYCSLILVIEHDIIINRRDFISETLAILKKNKKSMELFLIISVILIYRGNKTLNKEFHKKDMINMDHLTIISISYISFVKLYLTIPCFCIITLNNDATYRNTCSYDNYFMDNRRVGIWTNFN